MGEMQIQKIVPSEYDDGVEDKISYERHLATYFVKRVPKKNTVDENYQINDTVSTRDSCGAESRSAVQAESGSDEVGK